MDLCRRGFPFWGHVFTFVGVVITPEGLVLPLWAWFYLCLRGFSSVGVVYLRRRVLLL